MGLLRKIFINKYTTIFALGLAFGAVAGSGVMSKKHTTPTEIKVYDKQGNQYKVNTQEYSIESITDSYQKKNDSKLVDMLR